MRSNRGEELPPLSIQYKDFSQWRNTKEQREKMKQQEHFWVKQFAHGVPVLNLPIDYERSAVKIPEGGGINFEIDPEETEELKKIAVEEGATLFMLLLAVYYIFLYKITGQEDMIIAIPTAGRSDIRLENLIGFFVNVLSLRNYPTDDKSFIRFFREVKENTLQAFENQDYQFEDLVKKVLDTRELNRNPLMDALFQLFNVQEWHSPIVNEADTAGAKIRPYNLVLNRLINDIYISGTDLGNRLLMTIEYNKHLFKLETIEKFAQYFKEVVTSVVKNKNVKLEDIETSYVLYEQKINNPQMDFSFA
jgi:non-ribosomal peptide synthetase component F